MYTLHYIIPLIIFYFYRDKIMFWGLELINLIDLDHVYYRILGKVPWFGSACSHLGENCSFGFDPMHNIYAMIIFALASCLLLCENKKWKFAGWMALGGFLHLILDLMHMTIGFGI